MKKRSRLDPNEIVINNDYAEMILYNKEQIETARTKLSSEDVNRVSKYRWSLTNWGYVRGNVEGKNILLHNFILPHNSNGYIDHINRDKLDNRKENLRVCTKAHNSMNRDIQSNNTTGCRGVSFDSRRNKYRAVIKLKGKQIWLGYHKSLEDASTVRKEAEQKYFGVYAP